MTRLTDRVAIITGAASGIGRAAATLFAEEGARVLAVDRPGADLAFETPAIRTLACDLTGEDAPQAVVGAASQAFGRIDILYNNAGVGAGAPAADMTDAQFDHVLGVNLRAVFRLTRAAIPHLIRSPAGRIISTASIMARHTDYGLAAYLPAALACLTARMRPVLAAWTSTTVSRPSSSASGTAKLRGLPAQVPSLTSWRTTLRWTTVLPRFSPRLTSTCCWCGS